MDVGKSLFFCWIEQKRNGAMEDCLFDHSFLASTKLDRQSNMVYSCGFFCFHQHNSVSLDSAIMTNGNNKWQSTKIN